MEHIPRAQPRSCMLLDSCLYVLSMNMFVFTVTCSMHMQRIHEHYFLTLQGKKGSTVVVILQPLCVFYLLSIRDTFD